MAVKLIGKQQTAPAVDERLPRPEQTETWCVCTLFFGMTTAGHGSVTPSQFTDRKNDIPGLYYYRARYYHPGLGRFVAEDPIEFAEGDVNLYGFVTNNPLAFVDPLGLRVRNYNSNGTKVKPETGPWGYLPPCSEWSGSPDGMVPPGQPNGPPWHKFRGWNDWNFWPPRFPTPDNDVDIKKDGTISCVGGTCRWIPRGHQIWLKPPDDTWVPPPNPPTLPHTPIQDCRPPGSPNKSSG
jgi:RHS repeat-associated protein